MDHLTLLLAILYVYTVPCEEIFWDTTVKLAKNMTLECVYPLADTVTQMEWFKIKTERESMAIFNPAFHGIIREAYTDRVYFSNHTMASNDMTLSFHNASEADVGFYACLLHTFPHGTWEKVIQVVPPDSFEDAGPPNSQMVSEPGKNITLTCEPRENRLLEEVSWEKIQPQQIDLLITCNLSQGRNYTSKYPRQILSNCNKGMKKAFVTMPNVIGSDSGLYRCGFKASTGEKETFLMRLTVTNGETGKSNMPFVAGGAVLLFLLVILITSITVITYKRRKRQQKRGLFKDVWITQNRATNNYRNPFPPSPPAAGAGEDIYVNHPVFCLGPRARV
ncbi:CD226 antigen [Bubalus bubalis]|uniref:CD226 antigen n=1 Tax=Bubalus bubalis TaxID=89462 RepID=UPI001E1B7853|nr:CD226 antigen [Bubalus bubalis]XP_044790430.2 CD226 antigen [Bubalus bubalis]